MKSSKFLIIFLISAVNNPNLKWSYKEPNLIIFMSSSLVNTYYINLKYALFTESFGNLKST